MSNKKSPTEYFRQRSIDRDKPSQYALDEYKIDNLTSIEIKNFKSIKSEKLNLKSATFIAGLNSAGKSSFTQALIVILQWINNLSDNKKSHIPLNGAIQQLGNNVYDILNRGSLPLTGKEKSSDLATEITLNFKGSDYGYGPPPISDGNNEISIKFTLEPTESLVQAFIKQSHI